MRDVTIIDGVEYENMSLDNEVGFIEETHQYIVIKEPDFKFNSVTTLLKQYEHEFDAVKMSIKVSKDKKKPEYYGRDPKEIREEWARKGKESSDKGTELHNYGEALLNSIKDAPIPDSPKSKHVPLAVQAIFNAGYELAMTELLVYDKGIRLAGQSDILLKKKYGDEYFYQIYDWKFLKEPIKKKSFYNQFTRKYTMMKGPFKYLMDCNWIHYSIQLSIYQTMTGDPGLVTEKVLVVVTDDGFELVPCYPMRVFFDHSDNLQAIYQDFRGLWYDSRTDKFTKTKPKGIKGL